MLARLGGALGLLLNAFGDGLRDFAVVEVGVVALGGHDATGCAYSK